jgi:DNA-binding response OmpR family regulator
MPKKILLADDSVTIQKVVSITLAHEDFDLTIVDNGSKAVSKAKELKPDVILLDVVMPDKDGYQVCQEIKENADLRSIPIILLTGTFEPFDADRAAEVGADDFIKKPFESHTLINKVKEMASRSGVPRGKPVDISEVDIDFETPIEGEYAPGPAAKREPRAEAAAPDDREMTWEEDTKATDLSTKQKESEDIWSVEEFEDISGAGVESKPREEAVRPPVGPETQGPSPAPSAKGPAPKEARRATAASDDFFVRDGKPRDAGAEGFELGEEISEDELEKFLEEETADTEISLAEEPEADRLDGPGADDDMFMSEESEPATRPGKEAIHPLDEDLFVEDFEEARPAAGGAGRQSDDFLVEDSLDDGPIELEWEEEPLPKAKKEPAVEETSDELSGLIRRTVEEELADFTEKRGAAPGAGRRPAAREFEVDLSSFDEEPDGGEIGEGRRDSGTVDFEDLSGDSAFEEGLPARAPAAREVGEAGDRKDVSKAVDKIAREVIEKVVWEVVPELAEELIKQEIKRLKGEKS